MTPNAEAPRGELVERKPPGIHINELTINRFAATTGGRPVAERAANPFFLSLLAKRDIHIGNAPTRFRDSRVGTRMNDKALEAFGGGEKQQMLDSFAWLREKYFAASGGIPQQPTDHELFELALLGEAIPSYLMLRGKKPIARMALPEVVGNIAKASIGFRSVAVHNLMRDNPHAYTDPHEVYEIADGARLFAQSGAPRETCPASEQFITETAGAVLSGKGGDPSRSQLPGYISDAEFDNLVDFSAYNFHYLNAQIAAQERSLEPTALQAIMADLQNGVNVALGRDSFATAPSLAEIELMAEKRIVTPAGGLVHTAKDEIHDALVVADKVHRDNQPSRVIYTQRTTGKKSREKRKKK